MNTASTNSPRASSTECRACQAALPDLLFSSSSPATLAAQQHLLSCEACHEELASLQATSSLLDAWQAPEPSAWFDQRLHARLREAQAAEPEGFLERLRSRLLFSSDRQLRPVLAGGLALLLAIGGGTVALTAYHDHTAPQASATVQDLQILDRNDQALQTMDQLLDDNGPDDTGEGAT